MLLMVSSRGCADEKEDVGSHGDVQAAGQGVVLLREQGEVPLQGVRIHQGRLLPGGGEWVDGWLSLFVFPALSFSLCRTRAPPPSPIRSRYTVVPAVLVSAGALPPRAVC